MNLFKAIFASSQLFLNVSVSASEESQKNRQA
jgi:hypothetical protein